MKRTPSTRSSASRHGHAAFGALALALGSAASACSTSAANGAVDASPGRLQDAPDTPVADAAGTAYDAKSQAGMDAGSDAMTPGAPEGGSCPDGGPCDGGIACVPGAVQCAGDGIETCGDGGQWGAAVACGGSTPFCASATCTATQVPASCQQGGDGLTDCGAAGESCCTSLGVAGGTFLLTFAGQASMTPPPPPDASPPLPFDGGPTVIPNGTPVTVSSFRLDKYEVTVGRFRQFVNAWNNGSGYAPPPGSGKHTHVHGGLGLIVDVVISPPGSISKGGIEAGTTPDVDAGLEYEPGWLAPDDSLVTPTDYNLACDPLYATWTPAAGSREKLPINCINWWEAYAFCIWDGGFLPTTEEWLYTAGGGSEQREYPWGSSDPGATTQYAICGCNYPENTGGCTNVMNIAPVGTATMGAGLWGQLDLTGNVSEQVLDSAAALPVPCVDCSSPPPGSDPRGGSFDEPAMPVWSNIFRATSSTRSYLSGFRCARTP